MIFVGALFYRFFASYHAAAPETGVDDYQYQLWGSTGDEVPLIKLSRFFWLARS